MPLSDTQLLELFNRALQQPVGIEVQTNDLDAFRRRFYALKQAQRSKGIIQYDILACVIPPAKYQGKIWITLKEAT